MKWMSWIVLVPVAIVLLALFWVMIQDLLKQVRRMGRAEAGESSNKDNGKNKVRRFRRRARK